MHVTIDTDYFSPTPSDTLEILSENTNPRVEFTDYDEDNCKDIIKKYEELKSEEIPFEKLIIANYLVHGLDYCSKVSKRKMKDAWPNQLENHEQASDAALVLPVSTRAAKSILKLSQALDKISKEKGAKSLNYFDSMMQAYKLVAAYSGILNEAAVQANFNGSKYSALDSIISSTKTQFDDNSNNIAAGLEMVRAGKMNKKFLDLFKGRWEFMKNTLEGLVQK